VIKLVTKLLKELNKEKPQCKEFHPGCFSCQRYILIGLLEDLKANLNWEKGIKE
jgi:hypothetical protein